MIHFTGRDIQDSIKISIDDIRKANSKLIQLDYEKQINNNLRQVIVNDSIIAEQTRQECLLLRRTSRKVKVQRDASIGAVIVLLIMYLIK